MVTFLQSVSFAFSFARDLNQPRSSSRSRTAELACRREVESISYHGLLVGEMIQAAAPHPLRPLSAIDMRLYYHGPLYYL